MLAFVKKLPWLLRLAWIRFRRDPRTFPGAVLRGLMNASPRFVQRALSSRKPRVLTEVQPPGHPNDVPGRVSIVLPVHNQADLLPEAVESVLGQTWPDLELILLDDGSTDAIEPLLNEFAADSRVRIFRQPNRGLPAALTAGFRMTSGEFVTWTSADNVLEPDMLELLVARLREDQEAAMVYADYVVIGPGGEPLHGGDFRAHQRRSPNSPSIALPRDTELLNVRPDNFIGACFLYRSWVRRAFPDWRGALGVEDWDYWMRLNAGFRIHHLGTDQTPYRYRWHDNSLNARATEIRLLDKAMALMAEERERARWRRQRAWNVHVDESLRGMVTADLHGTDGGPIDLEIVAGGQTAAAHDRLRVVVWLTEPPPTLDIPTGELHVSPNRPAHDRCLQLPASPRDATEFLLAWARAAGPAAGSAQRVPDPVEWTA